MSEKDEDALKQSIGKNIIAPMAKAIAKHLDPDSLFPTGMPPRLGEAQADSVVLLYREQHYLKHDPITAAELSAGWEDGRKLDIHVAKRRSAGTERRIQEGIKRYIAGDGNPLLEGASMTTASAQPVDPPIEDIFADWAATVSRTPYSEFLGSIFRHGYAVIGMDPIFYKDNPSRLSLFALAAAIGAYQPTSRYLWLSPACEGFTSPVCPVDTPRAKRAWRRYLSNRGDPRRRKRVIRICHEELLRKTWRLRSRPAPFIISDEVDRYPEPPAPLDTVEHVGDRIAHPEWYDVDGEFIDEEEEHGGIS